MRTETEAIKESIKNLEIRAEYFVNEIRKLTNNESITIENALTLATESGLVYRYKCEIRKCVSEMRSLAKRLSFLETI